VGRPIAPRGAPMLEMGRERNEAPGAASENCSDDTASRQNLRAASEAAGEQWICHRDIVNLESRHRLAAATPRHRMAPMLQFDPSRAARPCPAGRFPGFRLQSPSGGAESSKRSDGSRTRMGPFVQPAGHLMMVLAKRLAQPKSEPAARTRSEFVTFHK
jgi:hypothetical protein